MRLRAKRAKKFYKNDTTYLRSIYRNNKELIDSRAQYRPKIGMEKSFILSAKEYMEQQGWGANKAANYLFRTSAFTTKSQRMKQNAIQFIKDNTIVYKSFKKATKLNKKSDIDMEKLDWSYADNSYHYNGITISFENSPKRVVIYSGENSNIIDLEKVVE